MSKSIIIIGGLINISKIYIEKKEGNMTKYDPASTKAVEFINHEEILETLDYGRANAHNRDLIKAI